jgi:WD40 repeat protein
VVFFRLWDLATWRSARPLALRRSGSWYAAVASFHPTGDWVVASTASMTRLTLWPLSNTHRLVVDGYKTGNRPLAFSADGKWLAAWGERGLSLLPLPGSGTSEIRSVDLPDPVPTVTALAFDPNGHYLFVAGNRDRVWFVPLDGSAPRRLQGSSEDTLLFTAAISPSGRFAATAYFYGGGEKTLRVWDLETGELRRFDLPPSQVEGSDASVTPTGYEQGIASMAFADESTLYTAGDGGLRRWNLETGTQEVVMATAPGYGTRGSLLARQGSRHHRRLAIGSIGGLPSCDRP